MKILFPLHLFYPSKIGGPANTIYWLCKALVQKGHKVMVVATKAGIDKGQVDLGRWVSVDGINAMYCDTESKFSISVIRHSLRKLGDVDAVVFSSICLISNLIIALLANVKGKQIIWSPRGELFDTAVKRSVWKRLYFFLLRLLLDGKVLFHATSEVEKESIRTFFPKSKIVVIPNYMEVPEKEIVNSNYSYFIYVGRIAPIKALDKLISALGISNKFKGSRYVFKFVGSVEKQFEGYYKQLKKRVKELDLQDKVLFVGSLTGKQKFTAYASARYSFLVSNSENFGNVVIEALSQGTPVVASKGTPWELLELEKAGYWIDNTVDMIATTIDRIIEQSENEYDDYRKNALSLAQKYDVYEHSSEWENILISNVG